MVTFPFELDGGMLQTEPFSKHLVEFLENIIPISGVFD